MPMKPRFEIQPPANITMFLMNFAAWNIDLEPLDLSLTMATEHFILMARCIPQTRATKLQQADEHANHHDHQQPQEDPRSRGGWGML